jgi:PDZ domain-containing protein
MKRILGFPLVVIAVVVSALVSAVPSGYYIIRPGGSYEIEPLLHVPDERRQEMGRLAFTAVQVQPASWADLAETRLFRNGDVVPAEEIRPPGVSEEEMIRINRQLIEESKLVAAVVGLQAAGFDARVTGQGAAVEAVLPGMPAAGVLRDGDIVIAADGYPVQTAPELVEIIRRHQVGDQVRLTIVRDGEQQEVVVGTRGSPSEPGRPAVGASVSTRLFDVDLPFEVTIDTKNVGGPSAGMMFALGILDAVTAGDLTRGHYVAGTGTISVDGSVGPIGGAAEKVVAAERDGAEVFLVPREDFAEAQTRAGSIRLVAVDQLGDALRALCGLEPAEHEASVPAPCTTGS